MFSERKVGDRVNDAHVHFGMSRVIYDYACMKDFDDIEQFRTKNGIDKMLVMPFDVHPQHWNGLLHFAAQKFRWLKPLHWITPESKPEMLHETFVGCKFHASFEKRPVNDPLYTPMMEALDRRGLILLVHCGRFDAGSRSSLTSFHHALDIAEKYTGIRVVLAHMGGSNTEVSKMAIDTTHEKALQNVWLDTSGGINPFTIERSYKEHSWWVDNRILFGSDYPWHSYRAMIHNILDARIPVESKKRILYGNFETLLEAIEGGNR
nr:amidohydrolase family protein [uncultured Nitrososphaera sp.]